MISPRYAISPVTLQFEDPTIEKTYRKNGPVQVLSDVRPGLFIFAIMMGVLAVADLVVLPDAAPWVVKLMIVFASLATFGASYTEPGAHHLQKGIFAVILLAGFGCALANVQTTEVSLQISSLLLILVYAYCSGLRFLNAFLASGIIVTAHLFIMVVNVPDSAMVILPVATVFLIASFAGYIAERQRRLLFAQTATAEEEREWHERMALHDPLTGLPNRSLFQERMTQSLARARRQKSQFAVMFIDLDNFKTINDNYGHNVGDEVLIQMSQRLSEHVRAEDSVARLGGDEFVILSEHIKTDDDVQIAAKRVLDEISSAITLNTRETDTVTINMTASLGISLCPRDGESLDDLIDRADQAMYEVKKSGKGAFRFFSSST